MNILLQPPESQLYHNKKECLSSLAYESSFYPPQKYLQKYSNFPKSSFLSSQSYDGFESGLENSKTEESNKSTNAFLFQHNHNDIMQLQEELKVLLNDTDEKTKSTFDFSSTTTLHRKQGAKILEKKIGDEQYPHLNSITQHANSDHSQLANHNFSKDTTQENHLQQLQPISTAVELLTQTLPKENKEERQNQNLQDTHLRKKRASILTKEEEEEFTAPFIPPPQLLCIELFSEYSQKMNKKGETSHNLHEIANSSNLSSSKEFNSDIDDEQLDENPAENWLLGASSQIHTLDYSINYCVEGKNVSAVAEADKERMISDWRQKDAEEKMLLAGHSNEEWKNRKRKRRIREELKEAKWHWKVFGEWVRKDWIEDEEEKQMWDEEEKKLGVKEGNQLIEQEGESGLFLGTIEELRNEVEEAERRGEKKEVVDSLRVRLYDAEKAMKKKLMLESTSDFDRYVAQLKKEYEKRKRKTLKQSETVASFSNSNYQSSRLSETPLVPSIDHLSTRNQKMSPLQIFHQAHPSALSLRLYPSEQSLHRSEKTTIPLSELSPLNTLLSLPFQSEDNPVISLDEHFLLLQDPIMVSFHNFCTNSLAYQKEKEKFILQKRKIFREIAQKRIDATSRKTPLQRKILWTFDETLPDVKKRNRRVFCFQKKETEFV